MYIYVLMYIVHINLSLKNKSISEVHTIKKYKNVKRCKLEVVKHGLKIITDPLMCTEKKLVYLEWENMHIVKNNLKTFKRVCLYTNFKNKTGIGIPF